MIPQEKSFATQAAMMFLAVTLTFIAVIGNGSFVAIFARFKVFRNFPNILFANLALIDFLNALGNVPLFAMYFVLQTSWLTGKTWAIISSSLNLEFALLNLVSMSVLMLDRFLAVYLDLKYFTWKTPKKAKIAVFGMWLVCTILTAISSVPLFGMDFEGEPLIVSRIKIFRERKLVVASLMVLSTITSTVLGMLTNYFINQKKKQRMLLNLPPLQAEARLRMDIKATNTVVMTIVTYYICYIPTIVFSIWNHEAKDGTAFFGWVGFMVSFCTFVSSASNPVIYVLRNRRCRSAFWQLVKDPCGTGPFQEKPVKTGKEENQQEKNPTLGREPGESRRLEENPESEELRRTTTATESKMPQVNRVVKLRTRQDKNDNSSDSLDEQVAVVKQAWQDEIETEERTDDRDFKSTDLVAEEAKKTMNEDERKEDENDDSNDSLDEQAAVVKQAWQDEIETEERTDDQDFKSAEVMSKSRGAKRKMSEDGRKEKRTFTGKKARTKVHPVN
ncbi:hypothetical protein ACROYT_G024348 [Oculina patagonica]